MEYFRVLLFCLIVLLSLISFFFIFLTQLLNRHNGNLNAALTTLRQSIFGFYRKRRNSAYVSDDDDDAGAGADLELGRNTNSVNTANSIRLKDLFEVEPATRTNEAVCEIATRCADNTNDVHIVELRFRRVSGTRRCYNLIGIQPIKLTTEFINCIQIDLSSLGYKSRVVVGLVHSAYTDTLRSSPGSTNLLHVPGESFGSVGINVSSREIYTGRPFDVISGVSKFRKQLKMRTLSTSGKENVIVRARRTNLLPGNEKNDAAIDIEFQYGNNGYNDQFSMKTKEWSQDDLLYPCVGVYGEADIEIWIRCAIP